MTTKTAHQLAADLLKLPDVPVHIEGWCEMEDHELVAGIQDENCGDGIIIFQQAVPRLPLLK